MKKQHRSAPRRNAPPRGARSEAPRFNESPAGNLDQITELAPDPAAPIPAVVLKHRISQTAVFRKQIDSVDGARAGDLVAVYSKTKQLIGYGLYNSRSEMALRRGTKNCSRPCGCGATF